MSIHINQVLDYLDFHPVCQKADNMETLMELLHDVYTQYNSIDSEEIRDLFQKMRETLGALSAEDLDTLFFLVCQLCIKHEQLAFSHGVRVGMQLMSEVNTLP